MELEQLQEDEKRLQREISNLNKRLNKLQQEKIEKYDKLKEIQRNIEVINSDVIVTDHSIVRYFERVLGYNIEEIRLRICPPRVKEQIKVLTNCKIPVENFEIVAKNNKVVTTQIPK